MAKQYVRKRAEVPWRALNQRGTWQETNSFVWMSKMAKGALTCGALASDKAGAASVSCSASRLTPQNCSGDNRVLPIMSSCLIVCIAHCSTRDPKRCKVRLCMTVVQSALHTAQEDVPEPCAHHCARQRQHRLASHTGQKAICTMLKATAAACSALHATQTESESKAKQAARAMHTQWFKSKVLKAACTLHKLSFREHTRF